MFVWNCGELFTLMLVNFIVPYSKIHGCMWINVIYFYWIVIICMSWKRFWLLGRRCIEKRPFKYLLRNTIYFAQAFKTLRDRPFFLPILIMIIIFFFFGWKSILRCLGNVSQNIRGLRVPEPPPKWGLIYIYNCMYHIIIVIISKNIS